MYVPRNTETRSFNHCCSGKAMSLTQPECMYLQPYAPYCHLWPAPLYSIFPYYLINGKIFEK
jgi:hypothetical protein